MKRTSWNRLGKFEIEKRVNECGLQIFENFPEDVGGDYKLSVIDKDGYKYYSSYFIIKNSYKRNKNLEKFSERNIYSLENISLWCKLNNSSIELSGGVFSNSKKTLMFRCLICEESFDINWNSVLSGNRCPYCRGLRISSKNNLMIKFPEISLDWNYEKNDKKPSEYTYGSKKCASWKCHICSFEWTAEICNRTSGKGCPECSRLKSIGRPNVRKKSKDYFIEEIYSLVGNEYSILEEYVGTDNSIKFKHISCGHVWKVAPSAFIRGTRCPKCKSSKGEKKISLFLDFLNIEFILQCRFEDCKKTISLPFDFYLPNYNLCIEFNGIQHYEPIDFAGRGYDWSNENFKKIKSRDKIKTKYCKNNNISLLIIPYWKFDNIEEILGQTLSCL
jgi:DNA-directed RNA polymerase subunit RPC12/RpoP